MSRKISRSSEATFQGSDLERAAEYEHVLTRLTFGGAIYVAAVCVVPMLVQDQFKVSFYFGGTSLLIIVSVALDTVQQIEAI